MKEFHLVIRRQILNWLTSTKKLLNQAYLCLISAGIIKRHLNPVKNFVWKSTF